MKREKKPLSFGLTMLASATGFIVASAVCSLLCFTLFAGIVIGIANASNKQGTPVTGDNIYLKIDLSHPVVEHASNNIQTLFSQEDVLGLDQLLSAIRHAASDSKISGIYLHADAATHLYWAQYEELRNALAAFSDESNKPIVAYAESYSQGAYYLASVADQVMLHPDGMLELSGIGAEVMYYKDLLDKADIHVDLIRPQSNAYKSAGETYTMNHMSEANREQVRTYLSSIWNHVSRTIAERRGISHDNLNALADNLAAFLAADAKEQRLIDRLCYEDDVKALLCEHYACKKIVPVSRYIETLSDNNAHDKIAVIYAEGNVVTGSSKGFETAVYADDIVEALHDAAKDKDVKAIVLRVNSPGGAVTASQSMTHAVLEAKEQKPVVVSMSGLAASAGYEISSNASYIVAHPTTITGSIGVFATIPEVGTMLRKHLGITTDTVQTNRNSAALSLMRPLSPTSRAMMQRNVEDFYKTFCQVVADGRGLTPEHVDSIGRGRVWTGADALQIGLVDTLGGLDLALRMAAQFADIEEYATIAYPKEKDLWQQLATLTGRDEEEQLRARLDAIIPFYSQLVYWCNAEPLQARLPYDIRF